MLERLFNPATVAIIGASTNPLKSGNRFLKGLIDAKYEGRLYPVNPKTEKIMNLESYKSIQDVPGEIDLAILAIPNSAALAAITECAKKKVKFVIVHTAGFGETGPEGREIQARMVEVARSNGMRIVGPNCMGIYSPEARFDTIMPHLDDPAKKESGRVAFVGQSGWGTETVIQEGLNRGLNFSKVISMGNQCDLTIAEYFEYLGADPKTEVIASYMEGLVDGRRLIQVAKEISSKKPIIVWKSGQTPAGAKAAASHTGSLASSDPILKAAFKQAGILSADSIFELLDYLVAFNSPYLPRGRRVGILVEAGGGAVAAADACEREGLILPRFSDGIRAEITGYLLKVGAPKPAAGNPVDLVWPPHGETPKIIQKCLEIMFSEIDTLLWMTYFPLADEKFAASVAEIRDKVKKPLFVVPANPLSQTQALRVYTRRGMPAFTRPEHAVKAISALVRFTEMSGRKA